MSAKALNSLYARISNLLDSYYLKIIVSEPNKWNDVETESRLDCRKRFNLYWIHKWNNLETESRLEYRKRL